MEGSIAKVRDLGHEHRIPCEALSPNFPLCYALSMFAPSDRTPDSQDSRVNLLTLSEDAAGDLSRRLAWPPYRGRQVLRWLYRRRARSIDSMTDLAQEQRIQLKAFASIQRFGDAQRLHSHDGTTKFLFTLDDGLTVESVLIPDGRRLTLCLSTQVGCTLDCGFCLTGTMGLRRNLRAHEIVDQVLTVQDHLQAGQRLTNVVMMGMGEPLANFEAVSESVRRLTNSTWGVGIPARRITISTAGVGSRLRDAAALGVTLAVSLNAGHEDLRKDLMPAAERICPLDALMAACRDLPLRHRQRVTFEYVLLAGVNDADHDAARLVTLLRGLRCKVNLIPFNPYPESAYRRPSDERVLAFQARLRKAGLSVFVRKSRGRDVLGACGQLGNLPNRSTLLHPSPIEATA